MATYTIIPRSGGDGYDLVVVGADGVHQIMLGFETEASALEWIAHDQALGDRVISSEAPLAGAPLCWREASDAAIARSKEAIRHSRELLAKLESLKAEQRLWMLF